MIFRSITQAYKAWYAENPWEIWGVGLLLGLLLRLPVVLALGMYVMQPRPTICFGVYYYDLATGKLYAQSMTEYPPILTANQKNGEEPKGVKANVFSCGRCREGEFYIGYLETYTPKARDLQIKMNEEILKMASQPMPDPAAPPTSGASGSSMPPQMMGPSPQEMMAISEGHLVASHEDVNKWYKQESPEGSALVNAAMKKCPDEKWPQQCFPGR